MMNADGPPVHSPQSSSAVSGWRCMPAEKDCHRVSGQGMPKSVVLGVPSMRELVANDSYRNSAFQLTDENEFKSATGAIFHRVK